MFIFLMKRFFISCILFSFSIAHAEPYIIVDAASDVKYVQGEIATSEQICTLINNKLFKEASVGYRNFTDFFTFPIEIGETLLKNIPNNSRLIQFSRNTTSIVIRNIRDCASRLKTDNPGAFNLISFYANEFKNPSAPVYRSEFDMGRERDIKLRYFLMSLGLLQTHEYFSREFEIGYKKLMELEAVSKQENLEKEELYNKKIAEEKRVNALKAQSIENENKIMQDRIDIDTRRQNEIEIYKAIAIILISFFTLIASYFFYKKQLNSQKDEIFSFK